MRPTALTLDPRPLAVTALVTALLAAAPLLARAGDATGPFASSYGYTTDDTGFGWSVFDPSDRSSTSNNAGDDWTDIQRSLADEEHPVFWFRLDGQAYVVREPRWVGRAEEITKPVRELGRKQGALGARQGELGRKQGALGARQGELGRKQGELGARQAVLTQKLAALRYSSDDADERRERRAIEEELLEVSRMQRELGRMQSELGRQQSPLGRIQGDLGRTQGELGREQGRIAKLVNADLRKLAEEAIREGKAEPVRGAKARRRGTI